jgi:hypothetical protein
VRAPTKPGLQIIEINGKKFPVTMKGAKGVVSDVTLSPTKIPKSLKNMIELNPAYFRQVSKGTVLIRTSTMKGMPENFARATSIRVVPIGVKTSGVFRGLGGSIGAKGKLAKLPAIRARPTKPFLSTIEATGKVEVRIIGPKQQLRTALEKIAPRQGNPASQYKKTVNYIRRAPYESVLEKFLEREAAIRKAYNIPYTKTGTPKLTTPKSPMPTMQRIVFRQRKGLSIVEGKTIPAKQLKQLGRVDRMSQQAYIQYMQNRWQRLQADMSVVQARNAKLAIPQLRIDQKGNVINVRATNGKTGQTIFEIKSAGLTRSQRFKEFFTRPLRPGNRRGQQSLVFGERQRQQLLYRQQPRMGTSTAGMAAPSYRSIPIRSMATASGSGVMAALLGGTAYVSSQRQPQTQQPISLTFQQPKPAMRTFPILDTSQVPKAQEKPATRIIPIVEIVPDITTIQVPRQDTPQSPRVPTMPDLPPPQIVPTWTPIPGRPYVPGTPYIPIPDLIGFGAGGTAAGRGRRIRKGTRNRPTLLQLLFTPIKTLKKQRTRQGETFTGLEFIR